MLNLVKFRGFVYKIKSGNNILIITKGNNCIVKLRKWTRNNLNLDLVKISAKFSQDAGCLYYRLRLQVR